MKRRSYIPARHSYTILKQLCNLIPGHMVEKCAKAYGVDERSRTFTPWSHVVSLLYAQLTHAIGLNDTCDALRMNSAVLGTLRGAIPPTRNTLSHANKVRDSAMGQALYWAMMEHLMTQTPGFAKGKVRRGYLRRFRKVIHAMDSTTIQLVANCMDWAKHRRRKAAAKCHLRLNLQSFLPQCAIIDTARFHDNSRARALCAGLESGEIVVFDKAYVDFGHLFEMTQREVWWVSRAKDNLQCRVIKRLHNSNNPRILQDEIIELTVFYSRQAYPQRLRRVSALVEVDGKEVRMSFLTNNFKWSAWTVSELYRCRWDIEVFFKEIKQTLQLSDFLGYSANAVRWQLWMGLLVHLLLRYLAYLHGWAHSFTRLFTVLRAVLWRRWSLGELIDSYGTAKPPGRIRGSPEQAYLPGFA
ncbi:MAG: IS4 family transposase [Kiritimatiellae bacterium]|nr:IS4 family transposase [Kiritimatiellia bacterium]